MSQTLKCGDCGKPIIPYQEHHCRTAPDDTESLRRAMIESGQPHEDLARAEQRWDTDQLREQFEVHGFLAPFIVVTRKSDGVKGSMEFTHSPRFYFNFVADND